MTRLLVSVRNAQEAVVALRSGVGLLDVKEPARGPLGRADTPVIHQVVKAVAGQVPISVAGGELLHHPVAMTEDPAPAVQFVKLGLSGCRRVPQWKSRWAAAVGELQPALPVAVIYADWRRAAAPEPDAVIEFASQVGCGAVLWDTFDKSNGDLFQFARRSELAAHICVVQQRGMLAVLAGSLTLRTIPIARALSPDYVAVRGAACRGGRKGYLDGRLVRHLVDLMSPVGQPHVKAQNHL